MHVGLEMEIVRLLSVYVHWLTSPCSDFCLFGLVFLTERSYSSTFAFDWPARSVSYASGCAGERSTMPHCFTVASYEKSSERIQFTCTCIFLPARTLKNIENTFAKSFPRLSLQTVQQLIMNLQFLGLSCARESAVTRDPTQSVLIKRKAYS